MDKGLRRIHAFGNQVVEVTRRVTRICVCCGRVTEETQREVVPLCSVLSGTGSMNQRSVSDSSVQTSICCSCPWRLYASRREELLQNRYELFDGPNRTSTEAMTKSRCESQAPRPRTSVTSDDLLTDAMPSINSPEYEDIRTRTMSPVTSPKSKDNISTVAVSPGTSTDSATMPSVTRPGSEDVRTVAMSPGTSTDSATMPSVTRPGSEDVRTVAMSPGTSTDSATMPSVTRPGSEDVRTVAMSPGTSTDSATMPSVTRPGSEDVRTVAMSPGTRTDSATMPSVTRPGSEDVRTVAMCPVTCPESEDESIAGIPTVTRSWSDNMLKETASDGETSSVRSFHSGELTRHSNKSFRDTDVVARDRHVVVGINKEKSNSNTEMQTTLMEPDARSENMPHGVILEPNEGLRHSGKRVTFLKLINSDKANCESSNDSLKADTDTNASSPRSSSPTESLSQSSQTDDFVAFRFLKRKTLLGTSSFPGCSQCAIGITPQKKYEKYFRINPVPESPDSDTTLEMARRHAVTQAQLAANKIRNGFRTQGFSLKLPLSTFLCSEVKPPADLTVEYALNKEWYRIYPYEWSIQQNITRNKSGPVDLAMLGEYNKQIALKTLNANTSKRESDLIIECQGPFVVQLCACILQADTRYLCMTYYDRRDLGKWMKRDEKRKYFGPEESVWICGYILAAIEFLHDKEILHLDIKPGNILIHNKGYPVVGDFGSSRRIQEFEEDTGRFAFTLSYASPEVMAGVKPDQLADLWPLACIFYELLAAKTPFHRTNDIGVQLKQALETTPDVSMCSAEARDFIILQLKRQKTERLGYKKGARDVMKHPVFNSVDWAEVKYAHRHSRSRLLGVFRQIDRDDREEKNKPGSIPPSPFVTRYVNKNKN